jgi:Protein of unknown function (DUF3034)
MSTKLKSRAFALAVLGLAMGGATGAHAQSANVSGRLLLTGGVSQVEGAAGGGLSTWAVIGGYGTQNQIGGTGFYTKVTLDDFNLTSFGGAIGINNRVELSVAQQKFDLEQVGAALGLGAGFTIDQTTYGAKLRLFGDAVLEQDSPLPQVSIGIEYKDNEQDALVKSLGADSGNGTDFYIAASKLYLNQSLLLNGAVRFTKANQFGILGFGSARDDYSAQFEGSFAYLLNPRLAIGAEVRTKPSNLAVAKEETAYSAFVAFAPTKNASLTLAYADLGNIVVGKQRGLYASLQFGF